MEANPYATPAAPVSDALDAANAPALWNPNATASWSLLFSPAFGSYLQMRNWRAMGEEAKAKTSWHWFIASIALSFLAMLPTFLLPDTHPVTKLSDRAGIAILLAWYFSNGREQAKVVAARFGKSYPRQPWTAPLAIAFGCLLAFVAAFVILGFMFGVM